MSGGIGRFIFKEGPGKWAFNAARFNQYGLLRDDCIREDGPGVKEALRRLPPDVMDARVFRIVRAMQLSCQKSVLPQEEWTKYEDNHRYLTPYLDEVRKEMEEKRKWDEE